ncbi:MAG: RNA polymerase sigma-I factor [Actinobacteria bacterium]|nr:RNA polymerase sigma-I factor [Actinomycetota bacterium]
MMVHKQTLEGRVKKARGDNDLTGTLITEFKPFIASVAQKRVGRYLKYGTDEELSVSLLAFKEAIDSFNPGKGRFLSFARMVISMRLIDYYRKQDREASMSPGDDEDTDLAWDRKSVEKYQVEEEKEDLRAEVIGYSTSLSRWGISLDELANVSPRRQELRELYQDIARMIAGNKDMLDSLMKTGHLPIKEIEKEASIHRKKLERGRIYIIAMVLAVMADLSYLDMCRSEG